MNSEGTSSKNVRQDDIMDPSRVVLWFGQLSNDEKNELAKQLFETCPTSVLADMKKTITLMQKQDFILNLPPEVSRKSLRYLDYTDIVNAQLVSKPWHEVIHDDLPLYRVVCEYLGVDKSEYETPEQATEICNYILEKRDSSFDDWFLRLPYNQDAGTSIMSVDFAKCNNVVYIITLIKNENQHAEYGMWVDVVNCEDIQNGQLTNSTRLIAQASNINIVKFLSTESIFYGMDDGKVQRWNIRPELVCTYIYTGPAVGAIDGNEELDLLFTGHTVGRLHCYRMSTGECLLFHQIESFDFITDIRLHINSDSSTPITLAAKSGGGSLSICSYSEDVNRVYPLRRLGNIEYSMVTEDGFRFLQPGNLDEDAKGTIVEYIPQTAEIRKKEIDFANLFDIENLQDVTCVGLGSKYCLYDIVYDDGRRSVLILFEKRGDDWKPIKKSEPIDLVENSIRCVLADNDWLNGIRLRNTKGVAMAIVDDKKDNVINCVYWK